MCAKKFTESDNKNCYPRLSYNNTTWYSLVGKIKYLEDNKFYDIINAIVKTSSIDDEAYSYMIEADACSSIDFQRILRFLDGSSFIYSAPFWIIVPHSKLFMTYCVHL